MGTTKRPRTTSGVLRNHQVVLSPGADTLNSPKAIDSERREAAKTRRSEWDQDMPRKLEEAHHQASGFPKYPTTMMRGFRDYLTSTKQGNPWRNQRETNSGHSEDLILKQAQLA